MGAEPTWTVETGPGGTWPTLYLDGDQRLAGDLDDLTTSEYQALAADVAAARRIDAAAEAIYDELTPGADEYNAGLSFTLRLLTDPEDGA